MEKITYTDVANLITQIFDFKENEMGQPSSTITLDRPVIDDALDIYISTISNDGKCFVITHEWNYWANFAMFNHHIITALYTSLCELWDNLTAEEENSVEDKIKALFEERRTDVFEFTTDNAIGSTNRELAERVLCMLPIELIAKKYLDACEIIGKTKSILDE